MSGVYRISNVESVHHMERGDGYYVRVEMKDGFSLSGHMGTAMLSQLVHMVPKSVITNELRQCYLGATPTLLYLERGYICLY